MISKHSIDGRNQFTMVTVDDLVPIDHLVRKIDAGLSFDFIYPLIADSYSTIGRPSIDPVVLIKLMFIQYLFGIRSMRQTIKEANTNVAYRWFLGFNFDEKVPRFSTFGKNYVRRFRDTTLFEDIFAYILEQSVKAGFVTEDNLYMDSTHIKANANKHKFTKQLTHVEAKTYQKEPESVYYVKDEREKQFTYSAHTACGDNNFILNVIITPGNVHDSHVAIPLLNKVLSKFSKIKTFVADAGYKTPYICKSIIEKQLRPVLPYTRPRGDKNLFRKKDFDYDEHYDSYICPNEQMIHFSTVNRQLWIR